MGDMGGTGGWTRVWGSGMKMNWVAYRLDDLRELAFGI